MIAVVVIEKPTVPTPMNVTRRPGTSYRYESLWIRLHKFAYLNAANFHCLRKILTNGKVFYGNDEARWLGHFGKLLPEQLASAFAITPEELELSVYIPYEIIPSVFDPSVFGMEYQLRYCPICMQQGFHCAVFQMRWIERCPLHDVPLENRCRYCGASNKYLFIPEAFKKAGHCKCGMPFWPNLVADVWPAVDNSAHEAVFGKLLQWVKRMRRTAVECYLDCRVYKISAPALAMLVPIPGWRLQDFGLTRDCITTSTYLGLELPLQSPYGRAAPPVVFVHALASRPYSYDNHAWLMPLYRARAKQVYQKLLQRIGRHANCAVGTSMHSKVVYFQDHLCVWAWAIKAWEDKLTRDGLLNNQESKNPVEWMRVRMGESHRDALNTVQWLHGEEFDGHHPVVVWLALEIFEAELFCDFLEWLDHAISVTAFWKKYPVTEWPCLKRRTFSVMYTPIASGAKPEVHFYFGVSLDMELFPLATSDVGCFNTPMDSQCVTSTK